MKGTVSIKHLKGLIPISGLSAENQAEIARKSAIIEVEKGKVLFEKGQVDKKTMYLLAGALEIIDDAGNRKKLRVGTPAALHPVDHHQPRQFTARVRKPSKLLIIDNDLLDVLLTWDQAASYVMNDLDISVEEIGDSVSVDGSETDKSSNSDSDNDWMSQILRTEIFMRIPPANIQKVFMRMQQVPVKSGKVIIRQGEAGDYYYMIQTGACEVIKVAQDGKKAMRLAKLGPGDGFGEEALISDTPRNATIRVSEDATLMRLSKDDFIELLKEPVLNEVDYTSALELMRDEAAILVDVRLEKEFAANSLKNSINLPLYLLRMRLPKFNADRKFIICCDSGLRSATAAYIMSERGFDVSVLAGGLRSIDDSENVA